jgi:beta-aspartyl-peptidase (threonine type)
LKKVLVLFNLGGENTGKNVIFKKLKKYNFMKKFALAIHGGAGTILKSHMSAAKEKLYKDALHDALLSGSQLLASGGSSLDAVELVVRHLEDCPLFNAGRGSVFTAEGKNEMEASIMEGKNLMAGAVAGISNIRNPVSLARKVLNNSDYVYLSGEGAKKFALENGVRLEPESYFFNQFRYDQWQSIKDSDVAQLDHSSSKDRKFGTVGAVALDIEGNLAAATSTGGLTNKKYGRIGDSSVIGAGCYANNATCAVSCTGYGEYFLRGVVAYDVASMMDYKNISLEEAANFVIMKKMVALRGEGGLIAVDAQGNVAMPFNSEGMYRGFATSDVKPVIDIYA